MTLYSRPLVSIGLPVYNGERYIRQALDSLLAQDYQEIELIISDNASTDQTAEICQAYAAKDTRIRFFRNAENYGAIANFNRVLDLATGDYFMWAACDDLWEPGYVSTLLRGLLTTPDAVLSFSAFNNINEDGCEVRDFPSISQLPSKDVFVRLLNYIMQDERLGKANPIYGLARRSAFLKTGGFKVWGKNTWGADMLVVFRLLSIGNIVLSPELLFHKRLITPPLLGDSFPLSAPHSQFPFQKRGLLGLQGRLKSAIAAIQERHDYFSGYARILGVVKGLSVGKLLMLRAALWFRCSQFSWQQVKTFLMRRASILALRIRRDQRLGKGLT